MRWLRFGPAKRQVQHDPAHQQELLDDLRQRFGPQIQAPFAQQAAGAADLLQGDDGVGAAATVLREFADSAYTQMYHQAANLRLAADRTNYRPLWQAAGTHLQWPLFALPCGYHPYIQVTAATAVLGTQARQAVRVAGPELLLSHVFEILDLTICGWEFGRVRVDVDAATLVTRLIGTARDLRAAMGNPPPLPNPVRELMRRNNTITVLDASGTRAVGGLNPGKEMREALLA
ncbi:hypothetical protein AB0F81_15865 [Actinoplanes sp. NPDC024001]|uniref:hypothetical protein n=1 Tax=Actinoplanes sp. NPDC024001 TaxID=3154598 RepID=UPI0033F08EDF